MTSLEGKVGDEEMARRDMNRVVRRVSGPARAAAEVEDRQKTPAEGDESNPRKKEKEGKGWDETLWSKDLGLGFEGNNLV